MGESTVFTDTEQDGGERNGQWLHPLDPQMSRNYRDLSPVQFYIRTLFRLCGWQCISSRLCFDQIDIAKGTKKRMQLNTIFSFQNGSISHQHQGKAIHLTKITCSSKPPYPSQSTLPPSKEIR